ncbi:hypothetical protein Tco_1255900, partial [Tanacetum coccineum]
LQVREVIAPIPKVVAHEHAVLTGSPSSTTVDQDAPSPKDNHDIEVAHMGNDPYFGIPIPEVPFDQSSSTDVKLDELGGILKNKARLVARGYREEEGIDIEESFAPKQAPRARYDMLSSFLISQDFSKGSVDPTLFIRKMSQELIHDVDDGKDLFFLEIMSYESVTQWITPMVEKSKLMRIKKGKAVDPSHYRGLRAVVGVNRKAPKCSKKIFRYLKGTVNWDLWYPKIIPCTNSILQIDPMLGCQDTSTP